MRLLWLAGAGMIAVVACGSDHGAALRERTMTLAERLAQPDARLRALLAHHDGAFERDARAAGRFVSGGYRAPEAHAERRRFDAVAAHLPETSDRAVEIGVSRFARLTLGLTLVGSSRAEGTLSAGRVIYAGVLPETDRVFAADEDAVEELLLLRSSRAPTAFAWSLEKPAGIARVVAELGGLAFEDADGRGVLRISAPYVLDAEGTRHDARVSFDEASSEIRIAFDGARVAYPCVLDPVFETYAWSEERSPTVGDGTGTGSFAFYDTKRKELVALVAQASATNGTEVFTWAWNGRRWRVAATSDALPALPSGATYDEERGEGVALLYESSKPNRTFTWNGSRWSEKMSASVDSKNWTPLAYVRKTKHVVHVTQAGDTLIWDGLRWTASTLPSVGGRIAHGLAAYGENVLLLGGKQYPDTTSNATDVWSFDGAGWTKLATPTSPSTSRSYPRFAQLPDGRALLYGGIQTTPNVTLRDTWLFDGTTWTSVPGGTAPPTNPSTPPIAWDSSTGSARVVGIAGQAWSLVPGENWKLAQSPPAPRSTQAVSTNADGELMAVADGRVWTRNATGWQAGLDAPAGSKPEGHAMAFDLVTQHVVLVGGGRIVTSGGARSNQTWLWDGAWHAGPNAPKMVSDHAMATNPGGGVVVMGGNVDRSILSGFKDESIADVWVLSGPTRDAMTWSTLSPSPRPPARSSHAMTFDAKANRVLLFGGRQLGIGIDTLLGDTWSWNGSVWTNLTPGASPPPRSGHGMTYSAIDDKFFLFAGTTNTSATSNDTWIFDGARWLSARARSSPPPSTRVGLGYDAIAKHVVAIGAGVGASPSTPISTWSIERIGGGCASNAECPGAFCTDGVCCEVEQCGTCETCGGVRPGKCTPVSGVEDPDSCAVKDGRSCSQASVCKAANGQAQSQSDPSACASGIIADGVCCDRACNGRCEACKASLKESGKDDGVCGRSTQAARPTESCGPATCDGDHTLVAPDGTTESCGAYRCDAASCRTSCTTIQDCVVPNECNFDGKCVAPVEPSTTGGCRAAPGGERRGRLALTALAAALMSRRRSRARSRSARGSA